MQHMFGKHSRLLGYLFISPWVIGFFLFQFSPLMSSLYMSLTNWNLIGSVRFTGIQNYAKIFLEDKVFWICFQNTFVWVLGSNILTLTTALFLANLLSSRFRGNHVLRTLIYIPAIMPPVAFGVVMGFIFSGSPNGFANLIVGGFIGPQGWFSDTRLAMLTAIATSLWFVGTPMIIFVAAIRGISPNYFDAARIDGAGSWAQFVHITLPLISPVLLFNLIMGIISGWQVYENILPLTSVSDASLATPYGREYSLGVYLIHIHQMAFRRFEFGYSAALGVILFCIVLVFSLATFRFLYGQKHYHDEVSTGRGALR